MTDDWTGEWGASSISVSNLKLTTRLSQGPPRDWTRRTPTPHLMRRPGSSEKLLVPEGTETAGGTAPLLVTSVKTQGAVAAPRLENGQVQISTAYRVHCRWECRQRARSQGNGEQQYGNSKREAMCQAQ